MENIQNSIQLENLSVKDLDKRAKKTVKKINEKKELLEKFIIPFLEDEDIYILAAIRRLISRRHSHYRVFNVTYHIFTLAEEQGVSDVEVNKILDKPLEELQSYLPKNLDAKKVNKICNEILELTQEKFMMEATVWFRHLKIPTEAKISDTINSIMKKFSSEGMYQLKHKMYEIQDAICEEDEELYEDCLRFLNSFYGKYQ